MNIRINKWDRSTTISFFAPFNAYEWGGIDYGYSPECIKSNNNYLIIKTKGAEAWSSVGETSYYPPKILIFKRVEILESTETRIRESVELDISIEEYGRKWKKAQEFAKTYIDSNSTRQQDMIRVGRVLS